jgi:phenylpropionate dioxygenase-like ring-hydroxylating dioxygenase large terminal subunit
MALAEPHPLTTPGTPDIAELVLDDRVHGSIYTDDRIFRLEMERIFQRTWVYVGHESEVRDAGDYKASRIGTQPVILNRQDDGSLVCLLNRCRHRAATVCREERGHGNFFRCPYHGWTYRSDGRLIGVPRGHRYGEDFEKSGLDLMRVPRVESYRGLVFACFDEGVEPLVDHLAQARSYLDTVLDLSIEGEIELSAGASRHRFPGNWKLQAENGVDGYHAMILHETFFEIQKKSAERTHARLGPRDESLGWTEAFDNGHALLAREVPQEVVDRFREEHPEYTARLEERHGTDKLTRVLGQFNLFIFPNLALILNQLRTITPVSTRETVVTMQPTLLKGAPEAVNVQRLREHEEGFSSGGFVAPDDQEVFTLVHEGLAAESSPWLSLERGVHDEQVLDNGARRGQPSDETTHRGIYRHYRSMMAP